MLEPFPDESVHGAVTLVALPGLGRNARSFPPTALSSVKSCSVRILCADYGNATHSIQAMAYRVWEDLDHADLLQPVVLMGYSMGGFVAQCMYSQQPARVRGIAFVSTTAPTVEHIGDFVGNIGQPKDAWVEQIRLKLKRAGAPEAYLRELLDVNVSSRVSKEEYRRHTVAIIAYIVSGVAPQKVAKITCPTLLLYGDRDKVIRPEAVHRLGTMLVRSSVTEIVIPGVSHYIMAEAPMEFGACMRSWLTRTGLCRPSVLLGH